jgi:invasion protein IalB
MTKYLVAFIALGASLGLPSGMEALAQAQQPASSGKHIAHKAAVSDKKPGDQTQGSASKKIAKASAASEPKRIAAANDWSAFTYREKGGKICYVVGHMKKKSNSGDKRDPTLLVTHDTGDKSSNVVSLIPGYIYKEGSSVELDVGGKKFDLFTKGKGAWTRDAATDKALVEALRKGKTTVVKGIPAKGNATTDTYSLAGFTQVLTEIDKACSVRR